MLMSLVLTFCTLTTCEEYVIDQQLTQSDCKERMIEERNTLQHLDTQAAYRDYMTQYKAEKMFDTDNGVSWELSCSK